MCLLVDPRDVDNILPPDRPTRHSILDCQSNHCIRQLYNSISLLQRSSFIQWQWQSPVNVKSRGMYLIPISISTHHASHNVDRINGLSDHCFIRIYFLSVRNSYQSAPGYGNQTIKTLPDSDHPPKNPFDFLSNWSSYLDYLIHCIKMAENQVVCVCTEYIVIIFERVMHIIYMVFGGERSATSRVSSGVPQGSVLGPVLFLLYTADVLQITQRHGLKSHSYADDIQLYCSGKAATGQIMNARMVACIEEISGWMTANRLKLNTDKTQFIWHGTRVQLMKVDISSIELDGVNIPVSTEVRCLGVVLDGELTFASHTRQLSRNCFYQLRQLWSVRRLLTKDAAKTLVHASILSRIDYCNSVLNHACAVHLRPLQSVLHSAARLILRIRKYDRISAAIREELHWLPVHHRIRFKTCALVHKCLHGLAPSYLIDMIGSVSKEPGRRHLRSAARGDLVVPSSRTRTFGPRAFAISGPDSWNNIPVALRDTALSFHEFCVKLKTELYRQINWNWTISAFVTVSTVRSFSARWTNFAYLLTYLLTYLYNNKRLSFIYFLLKE